MERQRNLRLQRLLTQHGYSHSGLGAEVNRVSAAIYGRPGDCTDRHVRRWVSGEVRWPWTRYLLPLERIFDRPAMALGSSLDSRRITDRLATLHPTLAV